MNTTTKNPYIGPRTFQKNEGHLFYGREREARDLISLVASDRLVVFYAQSGAGKSSIVNTRLIPSLEDKEFEVLPVGRVGGDAAAGIDVDNIFVYNLLRSWEQHETNPAIFSKLRVSDFLAHLKEDEKGFYYDPAPVEVITEGEGVEAVRRALVIDQFEELFSTHPEAWEKRDDFFMQLAKAMEDDPYLWVVLVMREDYIAALDPHAHYVYNGLRVRYYMQRLEREAALKAVTNPVAELRPYAEGVAEKLVDDLCSIKVQKPDGTPDVQPGQYVEPVQLQVVCYGLWENLASDGKQITMNDLQDVGDVDQSLGKHYERRVAEVATAKKVKERLIREWFEKKLITAGGIRNMVLQETKKKSGELDDDVIQALQSDLVRAEKRGGATWYELTHDRLVNPILERNKVWFTENLSPLQRQAALWKDQNQNESWLLKDQALAEVEDWATEHPDDLTDIEKVFLEACKKEQNEQAQKQELEAQKQKVVAERKLARQRRIITNVSVVATIVMVVLAAVAVNRSIRANEQTQIAQTQESLAEVAKATAVAAQKNAQVEAQVSRAGAVSAYAIDKLSSQPDLAILLSLQADQIHSDLHTRNALLTSLQESAHVQSFMGKAVKADEAQFSPNGKILALRNKDGIALWDAKSLQPLTTSINEHFSAVTALALSKDGKIIASASCAEYDGDSCKKSEIVLWDAQTGKPRGEALTGHKSFVYSVSFSPDGKTLASGSYDNTIILWDISDPNNPFIIAILTEHTNLVESVAFSPDGKLLASASDDQTVRLWDAHTGKPLGEPLSGHGSNVLFVTFNPYNGNILASSDRNGKIILWDVKTRKAIGDPLSKHSDAVWYMAFSPNGERLASGSKDKTVILWDVKKREPIDDPFTGHDSTVWSVAFNSDGTVLASSDDEGKIILWDVVNHKPFGKPLTQHKKAVYSLAFSPEGDKLVSGSLDSTIIYWNVTKPANPQVISELKGHLGKPTAMQFNSDGSLLASTGRDGTILIDMASKTSIGEGETIATHSNTDIVAYQTKYKDSDKHIIHIRNAKTGVETNLIFGENPLFSPDGKILVYQDSQAQLQLWSVTDKNISSNIMGENPVFSPISQTLITTQDGVIHLWNTADGKSISQPIAGDFRAFSSDSKMLAYEAQNPKTGVSEIHRLSIADPDVLDIGIPGTYLGNSEKGDVLAFKTVDADGIESINLLNLSTGVVTKDLAQRSEFLALSANGSVLFYKSHDSQGDYVNAINTETKASIGKQIAGTQVGTWELGQTLAYETVHGDEHSLTLINTSTLTPIEVVSNGSYLNQTQDKKFLVYQIMENKKSIIHVLDATTGLPAGEPIQGTFLSISPDGKSVIFRNESDSIVLWDTTRTWQLGMPVVEAPKNVTGAMLSLDGKTLAWIGKDGIALQNVINDTMIGEPFNSHFGDVTSVYFHPDNKTLITQGADASLTIWDYAKHLQAGEPLQLSAGSDVQLSKDGKILVVADSNKGTTALWDLATRKQIGDDITGSIAVLSPNGTVLAVGNYSNNTTALWDLTTYQPIGKPIPGAYPTFNTDGKLIAVGDNDNNQTVFWNLDPLKETGHKIPGYRGTFSSDGEVFVSYDKNDTTTLWNLKSYKKIGKPYQGYGSYSPQAKILAVTSSQDNTITLWNLSNLNKPSQLFPKPLSGSYAEFNSSGTLLAAHVYVSDKNIYQVSIYDLKNPEPKLINLRPLTDSEFAFSPFSPAPEVDQVAYVEGKGIVIWDRNSKPVSDSSLEFYSGVISGMTFNKSGDILAVYGNRGVVLWDVNKGKGQPLGKPLPGPVIPGTGITISPNGRVVASQATDGIVLKNLDTNKDTHLETGKYSKQLTGNFSFYAKGTRFVAIGEDGTLLSWDVSGGEPEILDDDKQPLKGKPNIVSIFSPDGRYLAYDNYGRITIWDIQESQPYMNGGDFPKAENSVGAITFSSDGTLLAYSDGPKILLWDILKNKKEKLGELLTESNNITSLNLIMNNAAPQYIVSADDSGTTQIWDWATRIKIGIPMPGNLQIVGFNNASRVVYYIDSTGRLIQWQWGLSVEAWKQLLCPLVRRNFTQEEWKLYFPNENYPSTKELLTCPDYPAGQ